MSNEQTNQKIASTIQRQVNRAKILRTLKTIQPAARVDLARETGLSRATVSSIVDELVLESLVEEIGETLSRGGRRPILLRVRSGREGRCAIGFELTRNNLTGVVVDLQGRVIATHRDLLPAGYLEPASLVNLVQQQVQLLTDTGDSASPALVGVGVGVPGLVDPDTGCVQVATQFGWHNIPLKEMLEKSLKLPVKVMNNVKAAALGEVIYSRDTPQHSPNPCLYLSLGQGIGSALIIDGKLLSGASHTAGEFGHITVAPDGPLCTCGNNGCLEAVAGLPALVSRYLELARLEEPSRLTMTPGEFPYLTSSRFLEAVSAGDSLAGRVVAEAAEQIAIALAGVINFTNPELIIFGGSLSQVGSALLEPLIQALRRRALPLPLSQVRLIHASLGEHAVGLGLGSMLISQLSEVVLTR
ncbi:MAG TPA: ROK family transcriptional regulator [Chloroflexia bacterium]|nr:ROK family transcriptional regulator [Chloroflexia bacterium]